MPTPQPKNLAIELALLAVLAGLWGSSYLLIKVALSSFPPITLMAIRVTFAATFLVAIMRVCNERLPRDAHTWRSLFVQSLLNSSVAWLALAWGQQFLASGLAGVLNSTSPLFVFLLTGLSAGATKSMPKLAGVLLGFVGVTLVVGLDALQGLGQQALAQGAVLFAAFLYACAAINGKRLSHVSPLATATGTMLWALVTLLPLSLAFDQPWNIHPTTTASLAAATLAILGTGGALIIYFRLIKTLGPMGVASQSYLRAGISVLLGLFILGEQLSGTVLLGLIVIIVGVALINLPARKNT